MVKGKRIAFVGNVSHKKGPMLLVEAFNAVHVMDPEFTLHIAGEMQEPRYAVYFDHIIPQLGLQDRIYWDGYITDVSTWLRDKDFILCTSPLEGSPVGLVEALSVGLTPLIYSFAGATDLFPQDFLWKSIPELLELVKKGPQDGERYRSFVAQRYNLEDQLRKTLEVVENLAKTIKKKSRQEQRGTVAVVMAVRNGAKTIRTALTSVLDGIRRPDQIIVVDDASTDQTTDVVTSIAEEYDYPIEHLSLERNKWVFSARNDGASLVKTDYFFFLDADDWVSENYISEMAKVLDNNPSIAVVYPDLCYFDENDRRTDMPVPEFTPQGLVNHNFMAYASMQRTENFFDLSGFSSYLNDSRNHLSEWELWLSGLKKGFNYRRHSGVRLFYFQGSDLLSEAQMSKGYERSRVDMHFQMAMLLTDKPETIKMTGKTQNILLVCQGKDYLDQSKLGFELMTFCAPFQAFGDVFTFQYDVEMAYYGKEGMRDRLLQVVDILKPAYIFHPAYQTDISSTIWELISEEHTTICWFSDDNWRYDTFSKTYGLPFRYAVTTYPEVYEKMTHPGKILSQWGANTSYFYPIDDSLRDIDVSFCGQSYGEREEILGALPIVQCFGNGWSNGFLDFKDMAGVLRRSKISINFSKGAQAQPQIKLRPFEICACGALCLCEYVDGIEKYYEPGKEIILFDGGVDLETKIRYFLENPEERIAIGNAAAERTARKHTWGNRFTSIFSEIRRIKQNELGK